MIVRQELDYQKWLTERELIPKWRRITAQPAATRFSKTPMVITDRESLFSRKGGNPNTGKIKLVDVEFGNCVAGGLDQSLLKIPGMDDLAYLQRMEFPMSEHYLVLYRSTRFPTPERISEIAKKGIVKNAGQARLRQLYDRSEYKWERERALNSGHLATSIMPQERIVRGLPVFFSVLDALGVHGEFRDPDLDQVMISAIAIPTRVFDGGGGVQVVYNPPVVVNHDDESHDLILKKFRAYWPLMDKNHLSYRVFPDSSYYRHVFGLQLYEAYLKNFPRKPEDLESLGINKRHFLVDLYGVDLEVLPEKDEIRINEQTISGGTIFAHRDILFGLSGGMDALGLERNPVNHLPFRLQEIILND